MCITRKEFTFPIKQFLAAYTAVCFIFLSVCPPAFAFNVDVTDGDASVLKSGDITTITLKDRAILHGDTSIGAGETVRVLGTSDVLFRDITDSTTNWLGTFLATGKVVLINTNGVYIGASASINVASLIASTLNIQNEQFLTGQLAFEKVSGSATAQVLNDANIKVKDGGYLIFMADKIINNGTITAYLGSVAMGSGEKIAVSFDPSGLVNLVVNKGVSQQLADAQITNKGDISAAGGKVQITAALLKTTLASVVNNEGIIEANSVREHGGLVELVADGGIENSGTIQASQLNESGYTFYSSGVLDVGHGYYSNLDGAINISGDVGGIQSDAGNIHFTGVVNLIGSATFQADSGGSGTAGSVIMNGFALTGNGFDLEMYTGVNDTLNGSITGVDLLTLNASTTDDRTFTSTGAAFSVATLKTNYHARFSRSQGSGTAGDPYMIYSVSNVVGGLQYIPTQGLGNVYKQANNINAADTSTWNAGAGFAPIGDDVTPFTGSFNGDNYTISGLFINRPSTNCVGLFGYVSGATIKNVGLVNNNVTGASDVGGLVGYNAYSSSIDNSYTTGDVAGDMSGGLVGRNDYSSTISNSHTTVNLTGVRWVGGLVGYNSDSSSIDNSYATGDVIGGDDSWDVGGLVGCNVYSGVISNSYATGSVTVGLGSENVGGLVGKNNYYGIIENSYATGNVNSGDTILAVGGMVGYNGGGGTISNSFYNIDSVLINGVPAITVGGIYDGQFQDWLGHGKSLAITDYLNLVAGFYEITSVADLKDFLGFAEFDHSTDKFKLTANLDLAGSSGLYIPYLGVNELDGNSKTVSHLNINMPNNDNIGFFGYATGTNIHDIEIISGSVIGGNSVGALVGSGHNTIIRNAYANVDVTGEGIWDVGGLVGSFYNSSMDNSYATGNVNVGDNNISDVGGLVGYSSDSSSIHNSYATGDVSGASYVGGLVGFNSDLSSIDSSYATGSVSGETEVGGLVGYVVSTDTLTNNWWYNALDNGVGASGSATSDGQWEKATAASDFFDSTHTVYNGTNPWDFDFIWVSGVSYPTFGVNDLTDIWTGALSDAWSVAGNWNHGVPTSSTNVLFNGTSINNATIDAGFASTIARLNIDPGYTGVVSQNADLSISGSYIQADGTFNQNSYTLAVGLDLALTAGLFNSGTGRVVFNGTGTQAIATNGQHFNNVTFDNNAIDLSAGGGNLNIDGALTIAEGHAPVVATNDQNITVTGTIDGTLGGVAELLTLNTGTGTVGLGVVGSGSVSRLTDFTIVNDTDSVVNFNADISITGLFTKQGTGDVSFGNHALTVGGLTVTAGSINDAADDAGTWSLAGNVDIGFGAAVTATAGDVEVGGDWTNDGVFHAGTSTVNFNGTDQAIHGTTTFHNLKKFADGGHTLTFESGSEQVVGGELDLEGGSATDPLNIRASVPGTRALLKLTGTSTLSYLDVKDSKASGLELDCTTDCMDSGNNLNWLFPSETPTPTPTPTPAPAPSSGLVDEPTHEAIVHEMIPGITGFNFRDLPHVPNTLGPIFGTPVGGFPQAGHAIMSGDGVELVS